ncbi:MAG: flagellar protein FlaG [Zoogloeaceae bacterium]|jgi:flagellar protein FlaG|nr:flagellar protein FlaG [Zoogloeaceae bacterium]
MDIHGIGGATPVAPAAQTPQQGRAPAAPVSRDTLADRADAVRGGGEAQNALPISSPVVGKEEANAPYWQRQRAPEEAARQARTSAGRGAETNRAGQAVGAPENAEEYGAFLKDMDEASRNAMRDTLRESADRLNKFVSPYNNSLNFSVDEETGKFVIKVVDNETKEVIKQIPSEELLKLAQSLEKLQGLLVRQKA